MENVLEIINEKLREIVEVLNELVDFEAHLAFLKKPSEEIPSLQWHYLTKFEPIHKKFYDKIIDENSVFLNAVKKDTPLRIKSKLNIMLPIKLHDNSIGALSLTAEESRIFSNHIFWLCELILNLGMKSIVSKKVKIIWRKLRFGILHRKAYFLGVPSTNEILEEYLDRCLKLFPSSKKMWGSAKILEQEQFLSPVKQKDCNLPEVPREQISFTYRAMKNANLHDWNRVYNTSITLKKDNVAERLEQLRKNLNPFMSDFDVKYSNHFSNRKIKTHVMIPSIYNEKLVALFSFSSPYINAIDIESIIALMVITAHAAPLIENARYRENTELQKDWLYNLYHASCKLNETLDINIVLRETLRSTLEVSRSDTANIMVLKNTENPNLCVKQPPMHAMSTGLKPEFDKLICPRSNGLTHKMLVSGEACYIENPYDKPYLNPIAKKYGIKSYLCLPLKIQDHISGALFIHYKQPHYFSRNEVQILSLFANQAAATIENALLAKKLKILNDIGQKISSYRSLDAILNTIAIHVVELVGAQSSLFLLVDKERRELKKASGYNYKAEFLKTLTYDEIDEGISGWVIRNGKAVLIPDAMNDKRNTGKALNSAKKHKTGPIIIVPLFVGEDVIGTLTTCNERNTGRFTKDDLELVKMLGNHAAIAIENYELLFKTKIDAAKTFHTIKGKASAISGAIDTLEIAMLKNKNVDKSIKIAKELAKSINSITASLVDLSRPLNLEKQLIKVDDIINSVIKELNISKKNIIINISKKLPFLLLEEDSLKHAIKEIFINAIEAVKGNDDFRITLDVTILKNKYRLLSNSKAKNLELKICILDNGPGVATTDKKQIWDLGFTRKLGGTGLGLFSAALRIGEQNGIIYENGKVGRGAKFNIILPLLKEE